MRWPWTKRTLELPPVGEVIDEMGQLLNDIVDAHLGCADCETDVDHNGPRFLPNLLRTIDHQCDQPRGLIRRHRWTCPVCRRTWTPEGKGSWFTNDEPGEIVAVTIRYPDGTSRTFVGAPQQASADA